MAPDWELNISYGGSDVDVDGSWRNVVGSPVVSAERIDAQNEGAASALAGLYRFTMDTTTTVSCSLVDAGDTGNPQAFSGTVTVVADGITENLNILPGWAVVLDTDLDASDEFEIGVGGYWDSGNSQWFRALPFGAKLPGFADAGKTFTVKNVSGSTMTNATMFATNAARVENGETPSRPFYAMRQTGELSPTADADLLGRAVTFDNFAAGSPDTVDILVDGSTIDVYDVTADTLVSGGIGLKCDETNVYRFADGTALQSVEFMLSADLEETDTATIYVSDGGDCVELATETGTWTAGTTGIDLTGDGETVTGTVADDDSVTVRIRMNPAAAKTTALNMRSFSLRASGDAV